MKRLLMLLICFVLLLSACDHQDTPATDYATDAQESDISYQMNARIAESEDSFYFMRNSFLYVIDKESHKCMPLCSRPDCRHDQGGENHQGGCDAYFILGNEIVNYRNELYYMDEDRYIDNDGQEVRVLIIGKMRLDGTNKQDVYRTEDMMLWSFKIHRGVIYFLASPYDDNGSDSSTQRLYTLPVSGQGDPKELFDLSGGNITLFDIRFYENHLFLLEEVYISENEQQFVFWRMDLNTGEKDDLNQKLTVPVCNLYTIFNGRIVYTDGHMLYECSLEGSECRTIADCREFMNGIDWYNTKVGNDETVWFSAKTNDGETLLIDVASDAEPEDKAWIILDKSYQPVSVYHPSFRTIHAEACNPDAMIAEKSSGNLLYYIDKTKLGSPDCEQIIYEFKR